MQLTRLEIKGFKSFGDKITINFNEGVTAIVGPNGCGKSNVVDSIRWVLGEQSTRMLRSEKMDNVIFNGSKSRKPANLAEVSLTFDNTKNILPTDFSQVTLTRRLFRSGESEYRLNDVQCRLKDITDLFLDTGIGADSYAIIELRMIDEIITNKEGSRRNLFEEAAGISKYKLRKKQTFTRLKDTEADLERVEDLLFELEKNLKTLENQAKKTEKYYRLKEQYKSLSLALASFKIKTFGEALSGIESREQQHSIEKTSLLTLIDNNEALLQQQKLENVTKENNLSLQQKATNEFIAKIRAYESDKKLKNEQLKFLQDKELRLKASVANDGTQLTHVIYNIKRLTEEKLVDDEVLENVRKTMAVMKDAVEQLKNEQLAARNEINLAAGLVNIIQAEVYSAEKELDILQIQQQALEQEGNRNTNDTAGKEAELLQFDMAITGLQQRLDEAEKALERLTQNEKQTREQINTKNKALEHIKENVMRESRKLDARQNEYNLTKSMVDNLEGFPESIRFLKKHDEWTSNVLLFSDVLFCREDYRIAIENYLEPVMSHYVVSDYNEAIKGISLLSKASKGRAQFFIMDSFGDGAVQLNQHGSIPAFIESTTALTGAFPALNIIEVEDYYRPLCNYLLKNVYLVDDSKDFSLNAEMVPEGLTLLGKSGKFNKSKFTISGGSVGLFDGKRIGRAKNLETLLKVIKLIEIDLNKYKKDQTALEEELSVLKSADKAPEIKQKQTAINSLNKELITVQTRREQSQNFITNTRDRKEAINLKISALYDLAVAIKPKLADLREQKAARDSDLAEKQTAFNELNENYSITSNSYNHENIRFHQQQNKVSGLTKDLGYREAQYTNLETSIRSNTLELEKVKADIQLNLSHSGQSDDDLLGMYAQKEVLEQFTKQAEEEYFLGKGNIATAENEIAALRKKKENANVIENALKDEKNNLRLELHALKERLSVAFSVDINDLEETHFRDEGEEQDVKEKTEKLKKQLDDFGAINPMAVEAYSEMNERYTFIRDQKKDLNDARASLLATIHEIDDTAKEKFLTSFMLVRENFIKVFRSLFNEEDSCDLMLTDPENPLESDIEIMAKPKGKRPLSINQLSGGEKTLTATAILFSLYLLKPAPFCIFDEVDAPLDDTNIDKFNNIIRKFSQESQFIVISHNKRTIASTDIIYGVTMVEQGISRVVPVDMREFAG